MTVQFATRIDSKKKKIVEKIHKKTHIPICHLTEKAFTLLDEYYKLLEETHKVEEIDNNFTSLLKESMTRYDKTYKKLAE